MTLYNTKFAHWDDCPPPLLAAKAYLLHSVPLIWPLLHVNKCAKLTFGPLYVQTVCTVQYSTVQYSTMLHVHGALNTPSTVRFAVFPAATCELVLYYCTSSIHGNLATLLTVLVRLKSTHFESRLHGTVPR